MSQIRINVPNFQIPSLKEAVEFWAQFSDSKILAVKAHDDDSSDVIIEAEDASYFLYIGASWADRRPLRKEPV